MAQSDYNIGANPSGLAMRTEINTIFDSILTHNSGSTAPTVTSAFMMWVDTSSATYYYLKMRNHDNTAWVTLFIYTVSTKVITPFIINSPTINALAKINADGTLKNSGIYEDGSGNVGVGTVSPAGNFDVFKASSVVSYIKTYNQTLKLSADDSANKVDIANAAGTPMGFTIGVTEVARFDTAGDLTVSHTYSNTTASAANMFVNSAGKFFRSTSSKQYKTNIEAIDNSYVNKFFDNARPIYYKSISDNDNPKWGYWGFIAEEIAEFDKRLVHWRYQTKDIEVEKERVIPAIEEIKDKDENIIQESKSETIEKYIEIEQVKDESKPLIAEGVMYERITVLLTAKVQEQQKTINDLILRIEALESK